MKKFLILLLLAVSANIYSLAGNLRPEALKCEYLDNPEAVDVTTPRLSWINSILNEKSIGEKQTAWQVQVATSKEKLESGTADIWDSQKTAGESSPYILYNGTILQPATKYWWRVRVWDLKDKPSDWSTVACWATGLMGNWKAKWIGAPWDKEEPRDIIDNCVVSATGSLEDLQKKAPSTIAPIIKKDFKVSKNILSARLYTSGLGYFEVRLNNEKISEDLLSPNQTDYSYRSNMDKRRLPLLINSKRRSVMYLGYDITSEIKKGNNTLEYLLGNGFYNSVNVWVAGYGSPRMIAQLEIKYEDGTTETIVSDESWKVRESNIIENDVYAGEIYDASHNDNDWKNAVLRKSPDGELVAQTGPKDKVMETMEPESIEKISDRTYKVKFKNEISGRINLFNIKGLKGDTINIRFLNDSYSDYDYNGTVTYICSGSGKENYSTRFSWFVFNSAIISNWPGDEMTSENIQAESVYSDVPQNASFTCSNETINSIVSMWIRTQKNNMHGSVPTDCPHRERGPYTGDGQLTAAMVMHNFDARSFYLKWISDINNSQDKKSGYVPNSAPWEPGCGGGVAWGAAMTILPWEYYLYYGDKKLLEDNYPAMKAQTDYMDRWKTREGTMHARVNRSSIMNLGEHVPPFSSPSEEFIHTYVWLQCCEIMAQAATALGKTKDFDYYDDKAGDILGAFMAKYYNYRNGSYGKDECDVIALRMRIIEEEKVIEDLKRILQSHDGHILTGYVGTRIFFETLSENGLDKEAYHALTAKGYPGYADMIEKGSTTMWEQWDGKHSHDHPGLGSGLIWIYRYLAGVKVDWQQPAYRHFEISPYIPEDMTFANYSLETVYGPLKSGWKKDADVFSMDIKIPEGCTCTLIWPIKNVKVNGKAIGKINKQGEYTLSSGSYHLYSKRKFTLE